MGKKRNIHATATQCNFYDHFCKISASFYDYLGEDRREQ